MTLLEVLDLVVAIEAIVETDGILHAPTYWQPLPEAIGYKGHVNVQHGQGFVDLYFSYDFFRWMFLISYNSALSLIIRVNFQHVVHVSPLTSAPPWAWNHRSQCRQARLPLGHWGLVILGDSGMALTCTLCCRINMEFNNHGHPRNVVKCAIQSGQNLQFEL